MSMRSIFKEVSCRTFGHWRTNAYIKLLKEVYIYM